MRKSLLFGMLVVFLVGCNTLSGTRRYTDDPRQFLAYAASNKDVKTIVVGNPTSKSIASLENSVTKNLNESYRFSNTNFAIKDSTKMQKPYKIVFAFGPQFNTTADEVCAAPNNVKMTPSSSRLFVMVVFCGGDPISKVEASVDYAGPDKDANLEDAIKQIAVNLVPQEEPLRSYASD
jgi:hypothetical protein